MMILNRVTTYLTETFQVRFCTSQDWKCYKSVNVSSKCLLSCEGVLVTSYVKSASNKDFETFIPKMISDYDKYKDSLEFPSGLKGK